MWLPLSPCVLGHVDVALTVHREAELSAASRVLGMANLAFLGYQDGELDRADHAQVLRSIADHIRRVRPQVLVTFDPNRIYGHPDHIAISQLATTAVTAGADPGFCSPSPDPPHLVAKLYYRAFLREEQDLYEAAFGPLAMPVDRVDRAVAEAVVEYLSRFDAPMRVAQLRVLGGAMARVEADATAFAHRKSRTMVNIAAFYLNQNIPPAIGNPEP